MKMTMKIKASVLMVTLLSGSLFLNSCKDEDDNGGGSQKVDPSTIATSDLVAYFPFDGSATESIASLTPSASANVTYITGRRGQAYQGADGAYLIYTLPDASKIKSLTSYTLAMWLKSPLVTGDPEPTIFEIGKSTDLYWGNLKFMLNRTSDTSDSLQLKSFFYKDGVDWSGQHISFSSPYFLINTWMHIVVQYDESTSKYMIYKDGVKITTSDGIENRYAASEDVDPRPSFGAMGFTDADKINIGSWRTKSEGTATDAWMGWFLGNIDELRLYDIALTADQIKQLYDAEVSQLNEE